jgi:uncharacterized protein YjiS (DUF1127 family)
MGTIDTNKNTTPILGDIASAHTELVWRNVSRSLKLLRRRLAHANFKHRSRQVLRDLSDDQLKDIGITRYEAMREANKPYWE